MAETNEERDHYLLQFFNYDFLPPRFHSVCRSFCRLAMDLDDLLPENPEKTPTLRKLPRSEGLRSQGRGLQGIGWRMLMKMSYMLQTRNRWRA